MIKFKIMLNAMNTTTCNFSTVVIEYEESHCLMHLHTQKLN